MQIPQQGQRIMYVAADGQTSDSPVVRAGVITRVNSYNADSCRCNLLVFMDGPNDMQPGFEGCTVMGFQVYLEQVPFAERGGAKQGYWYYPDNQIHECFNVETELEIQHGRETIRAGAIGRVDTSRDTIEFNESDITNLPKGEAPSYPASKFLNMHAPRIRLSGDRWWFETRMEATAEENPDERAAFLKDVRRQASDLTYRRMRQNGMPSQYETASMRMAREQKANHTKDTAARGAEMDTSARDDSSIGGKQRLNLDEVGRSSRPREAVASM